ncbi:MAG: HD domain-containing protein [Bacteroidetes bacterium]|nr:MAG: HD domain-containing protein [Bacteroidota bacterium]
METEVNIEALLNPETDLEKAIVRHPDFVRGVLWGEPRFGHPEGRVLFHIREIFDNIDALRVSAATRQKLRLIALAHDTFKADEPKGFPRDWSRHHGVLGRRFLEQFTRQNDILEIVELHDEAYYAWRMIHLYNCEKEGHIRLQKLLDRLGDNLRLYYLFFKCDTETGDKIQAPLRWFEETVEGVVV